MLSLDWLEPCGDFRSEYRAACANPEPAARLSALRCLSRKRLKAVETIQLARALPKECDANVEAIASVRPALLADANVEHLVPFIRVALLRHGLLAQVYVPGYGQYRQELMTGGSPLFEFRPDVVVFALGARSLVAGLELDASEARLAQVVDAAIADLSEYWHVARRELDAEIVQQTVMDLSEPLFGSYDRLVPGSGVRAVAELNARLAASARDSGVLLLDIATVATRDGSAAWYDPVRWHQAKQDIQLSAAPAYAELLARLIAARRGRSRKCLVLDLDNTLWGGTVGDDGLDGIVLGPGSALGEAHLAFQQYVLRLKERGIVLAVCSKNDHRIAMEAFSAHPEMAMRPGDVAAFVANWEDKASNLVAIAQRLNLGLESLVFVDDSPVERAQVRGALPDVAVPEMPVDPARFTERLAAAGYFEAVSYTSEDQSRANSYRQDSQRETLRQTTQSLRDFLAGLDMRMRVSSFQRADVPRIVQLINKTNQFNLTARRHDAEFIERVVRMHDCVTLQFRLSDRFGDTGLVAAMILLAGDLEKSLLIDTWVMSCRVFGRQLEYESMNVAVETARALGVERIVGQYVPTQRNVTFRSLYGDLGFSPEPAAAGTPPDSERWVLRVGSYVTHRTHIQRSDA